MSIRFVFVLVSILTVVSSQNLLSDEENLTKVETTNKILDTMMESVKPKELFKV